MNRVFFVLIIFLASLALLPTFYQGSQVIAATENCNTKGIYIASSNVLPQYSESDTVRIQITLGTNGSPGIVSGINYGLHTVHNTASADSDPVTAQNNSVSFDWSEGNLNKPGVHKLKLLANSGGGLGGDGCWLGIEYVVSDIKCSNWRVVQNQGTVANPKWCYASNTGCIDNNHNIVVMAKLTNGSTAISNSEIVKYSMIFKNENQNWTQCRLDTNPGMAGYCATDHSSIGTGRRTVYLGRVEPLVVRTFCESGSFVISDSCNPDDCDPNPTDIAGSTGSLEPYKICDQIDREQEHLEEAYNNCIECVGGDTGTEGIWTAIGCIKRDPTEIVQNLLRVGLGMGGGVALLMILAAGFLFSISQGDPKRTGEAKELITAAITGLLFIIFSVVILQFIGYTVLQIPGFGG